MSWATLAEAEAITGVSDLTEGQLNAAQSVIDIYANRTEDALDSLSQRDLGHLKSAVSWQAVWQRAQPGFGTRSLVSSVNQDGAAVQYPNEASLMLAPLAQRALRNLSWKTSRTLVTPSARVPRGGGVDWGSSEADNRWPWVAM